MRENTEGREAHPGSIPGGGSNENAENHSGSATADAASEVGIAKGVAESGRPPAAPETRKRQAPVATWEGDTGILGIPQRKRRKEGLCKRRGCRNTADPATRFCAFHEPKAAVYPPPCPVEGCALRANATGFCCTHQPAEKTPEETRPETPSALKAERAAESEVIEPNLRCKVDGCTLFACSPAGICAEHLKPRRCVRCAEQGEETFIGPEVQGDVCSWCAGRKCARKGCGEDRVLDSIYCAGHKAAAACVEGTATCDNLPVVSEPDCECCHAGTPCVCCPIHGGKAESAADVVAGFATLSPEEESASLEASPAADPSPLERAHRRLLAAREKQVAADAAWREAADDFSAAWLAEADRARGKAVRS